MDGIAMPQAIASHSQLVMLSDVGYDCYDSTT